MVLERSMSMISLDFTCRLFLVEQVEIRMVSFWRAHPKNPFKNSIDPKSLIHHQHYTVFHQTLHTTNINHITGNNRTNLPTAEKHVDDGQLWMMLLRHHS